VAFGHQHCADSTALVVEAMTAAVSNSVEVNSHRASSTFGGLLPSPDKAHKAEHNVKYLKGTWQ
jgi:hypothetical protein